MTSPSTAARELLPLTGSVPSEKASKPTKADTLPVSTTSTSASAALARSLFLFLGLMFRRPSKLFRPSRVDTWGGLRHLALQADQSLSPSFIRSLMRSKSGAIAMGLTILPPLVINTTLGFLLFTSHSFFALTLARLPFFRHPHHSDPLPAYRSQGRIGDENEEEINIHTLISGPTIIPRHPTLLSALSGAGAGLVQGVAFTPIENVVRLIQQSATSLTSFLVRTLRLPLRSIPTVEPIPSSPIQAIQNFLSSERWRKSPSWWTGWRWTAARDALSYSVFFAGFDITRRVGLRAKAFFGGPISAEYHNVFSFTSPSPATSSSSGDKAQRETPTIARVAQASTIVAGGVTSSLAAEIVGRPFRACQRIMQNAKSDPTAISAGFRPVIEVYRAKGLRPFILPDNPQQVQVAAQNRLKRLAGRAAWRLAAVGPWGFGFLVWAWVGGEV